MYKYPRQSDLYYFCEAVVEKFVLPTIALTILTSVIGISVHNFTINRDVEKIAFISNIYPDAYPNDLIMYNDFAKQTSLDLEELSLHGYSLWNVSLSIKDYCSFSESPLSKKISHAGKKALEKALINTAIKTKCGGEKQKVILENYKRRL